MITVERLKYAMISKGILEVEHHTCAGCNYMTKYVRIGEQLYFDPGCNCSPRYAQRELVSWQSAADYINMQTDDTVRLKIKQQFGLV